MKLLVEEPGSPRVEAAWRAATRRVSSRLLYPEAQAALAAAARSGRLDTGRLAESRRFFERVWQEIDIVEVTDAVALRAGDLAEEHALRGYDAVHLASAESVADPDAMLVTADTDLRAAASARGITTLRLP